MMKAACKSWRHQQTRVDDGGNEALPQTSDVSSDKRHDDGGREVARECRRKGAAAAVGNGGKELSRMADGEKK
jgi:hypothetical protein